MEEDFDMLRAYLDLEQLRTGHRFDYTIKIAPDIDQKTTAVPMLILQPIVENAVWHGFDVEQQDSKLEISVNTVDDSVYYSITDNGKLSSDPKESPAGKTKSMGSALIQEQLEAIRQLEKREAKFFSKSIKNDFGVHSGTFSEIMLPYIPYY